MTKLLQIFKTKSFLSIIISIILGFFVGAIVMLLGGYSPIVAYSALFGRVYGDAYNLGEAIRVITPLIFTGLSFAFAARTSLFNIGAEGQLLIGMTASSAVAIKFEGFPSYIHAPVAVLVGALFGGLWAAIAGYLKAKRGVNEVITCIMLNWIALYTANLLINQFMLLDGQGRSKAIQSSASISIQWLSQLMGNARMHWGMFIAIIAVFFFYFLLWKTTQGYELRAVGLNQHAAHYAGINIKYTIVKSMFISGAFAGLAGAFELLGVFHYQSVLSSMSGIGFDGIAVALIGMNHPVGVLLAAVLFGTLTYGSAGMSFAADVPPEIIRIVIGSIIFFIAAKDIVRYFLRPCSSDSKKEKVL